MVSRSEKATACPRRNLRRVLLRPTTIFDTPTQPGEFRDLKGDIVAIGRLERGAQLLRQLDVVAAGVFCPPPVILAKPDVSTNSAVNLP